MLVNQLAVWRKPVSVCGGSGRRLGLPLSGAALRRELAAGWEIAVLARRPQSRPAPPPLLAPPPALLARAVKPSGAFAPSRGLFRTPRVDVDNSTVSLLDAAIPNRDSLRGVRSDCFASFAAFSLAHAPRSSKNTVGD